MIHIGSDHRGYNIKKVIIDHLTELNFDINDVGPSSEESVDYPDFAHQVAKAVNDNSKNYGILICYTSNGMAMCANKYPNVRAGVCWNPEIAKMVCLHNDANVLCIPAGFVDETIALDIVANFLATEFEGGRHAKRVDKIKIDD